MQQKSICFIGGGNMAQAIVFGLLKKSYTANLITVCDRNESKRKLFAEQGVNTTTDPAQGAAQADVVVLAVKPQSAAETCITLSAVDFSDKLVISIMAAISTQRLTALLPTAQNIVRVMPNTPSLVSEGMAGLFAQSSVAAELQSFAEELLNAVGKTCWVTAENDMHKVTAASGSSPAYFFLFMEAMQHALLNMGLTEKQARELIQQSAFGAAKMVVDNPQTSLTTLRENVTSKGGTTAAALAVFNDKHLVDTVEQAMLACVARSKEREMLF